MVLKLASYDLVNIQIKAPSLEWCKDSQNSCNDSGSGVVEYLNFTPWSGLSCLKYLSIQFTKH